MLLSVYITHVPPAKGNLVARGKSGGNRLYGQLRQAENRIKELEKQLADVGVARGQMEAERDQAIRGQLELRADIAQSAEVIAAMHLACQYSEYAKDKIVRLYLSRHVAQVASEFNAHIGNEVEPPPATPPPVPTVGAPEPTTEGSSDPDAEWEADMAEAEAESGFTWGGALDDDELEDVDV